MRLFNFFKFSISHFLHNTQKRHQNSTFGEYPVLSFLHTPFIFVRLLSPSPFSFTINQKGQLIAQPLCPYLPYYFHSSSSPSHQPHLLPIIPPLFPIIPLQSVHPRRQHLFTSSIYHSSRFCPTTSDLPFLLPIFRLSFLPVFERLR